MISQKNVMNYLNGPFSPIESVTSFINHPCVANKGEQDGLKRICRREKEEILQSDDFNHQF